MADSTNGGGGTPLASPDEIQEIRHFGERVAALETEIRHGATKEDLLILQREVTSMRADVKGDNADLKTSVADLRTEIKADFADLEKTTARQHTTLITWVATILVIAAISLLGILTKA